MVARKLDPAGLEQANLTGEAPAQAKVAPGKDALDMRAQRLLADEELSRLLVARPRPQIDRSRQIFVNRNLRMSKIELIGFDMDYTLAIYHMRRIEKLSFVMTLAKLITDFHYSPQIESLQYDHEIGMRGIAVDKPNGNLLKMDRFGFVGRAYHGRRPLGGEARKRLYRDERIKIKTPQYAWIDTLFALPEACLFAGIIELLEAGGEVIDYAKLYDDIRMAIDTVHRDNSLKQELKKDLGRYIFKDPELGPALHRLRSGGKKLFLLTNSLWDYTDDVMRYLLDGMLPEYPSWRNYFDFIVTGAAKPAFFAEQRPFHEIDTKLNLADPNALRLANSLERFKVYQGGNLLDFEKMTGFAGDTVLYVGDHIYGDILKSKKASLWRTCMIVQELEEEIKYTDQRQAEIAFLSSIELLIARIEDEVNYQKSALNALERRMEKLSPSSNELPACERERRQLKLEMEKLRKARREANEIAEAMELDVELGFNPFWGLLFKEANENSRFGEQVEQYACLYTSRVSNFLHYSPMQYFRSPREVMPHEQAGALSAQLSPLGSEGPPKGSETI